MGARRGSQTQACRKGATVTFRFNPWLHKL